MAPMAMAMPPSDMILAVSPISRKWYKRQQDGNRNGDHRNDGAGNVPEKKENHKRNGHDDFHQGGLQVVDGPENQFRSVIDGNDLHPGRQSGLDFPDFGLDAVNDIEGVLSLPHDHDAGDNLAGAVKIRDAPAQIRAENHLSDVFDADRGAVFTRS